MTVGRAFVGLAEGLVHLRRIDGAGAGRAPLLLLHASPGSSRGLEPLLRALHARDPDLTVIAPDTLGTGDSAAPAPDAPDIAYYAGSVVRLLDALGLERVHLYGAHTGARIACEAAAAYPDRVEKVIFDGIGDYDAATRRELIERYAPEMAPDDYGRQFVWAFNFVRDINLHFPHYARDPAHRLNTRPVPSADELHASALEVLKGLTTYHKAYRAAFAYETGARIGLIRAPALLLRAENELPNLRAAVDTLAALLPGAATATLSGAVDEKSRAVADFLDGAQA